MADAEKKKNIIWHYLSLNFNYKIILSFLEKYQSIKISQRTLLNLLKEYQLWKRDCHVDEEIVCECIRELDGSGSVLDMASTFQDLSIKFFWLSLIILLEPRKKKAHRLRWQQYSKPNPSYCWHSDAYDKPKPYGFLIHASSDKLSQRIIWL